ncbi:MAG: HTTM domain-containing protein [Flavobacteriaceae bacterium]|nr:HTTM domain-containing protein [Flavobacteriaceae bacterium]|tara:strand:+ start:7949 stop:9304 length:1356 start_codon:yes stop_codon:yes gene_type:complete
MKKLISDYLNKDSSPYPLSIYRIGFGILVMITILRFWYNGWIDSLYIVPDFHFSYYGFSWVKPMGIYTYLIFYICFFSALFVMLGYKYKYAIVTLFLSFTYIELMDKTTYLNHYYLVSSISFLMIFLPCNSYFSIDSKSNNKIPKWTIDSLKLLIVLVYLYAGLAKINSDWLINAQPLKIWLKTKYSIPLIGESLLQKEFSYYLFSWGGMLYDISIPFLLLFKRTRVFAFIMVIIFHILTRILFPPIGMFPYIMIFSCIIFFNSSFHKKIIEFFKSFSKEKNNILEDYKSIKGLNKNKISLFFISGFFIFQILVPLRSAFYTGELFWNEQGYRFSWRVMLIEKTGYTTFKIVDKSNGKFIKVNNRDYLTMFQEKQMSFQPDMILEYAHYLGDIYKNKGFKDVSVYAESYVTLNGRPSQQFVDPKIDLYKQKRSFKHIKWIIPFTDEIKSLL